MTLVKKVKSELYYLYTKLPQFDLFTPAAAFSFYSILSLGPLIMLMLTAFSYVAEESEGIILRETKGLMGERAAETIQILINNIIQAKKDGNSGSLWSIVVLLVLSSFMFVQLKHALNTIFNAHIPEQNEILLWLKQRFQSVLAVIGFLLVLIFFFFFNLSLSLLFIQANSLFGLIFYLLIYFLSFWIVFAMIFKFITDAKLSWKHIRRGSFVTTVLFVIGRQLIEEYIVRSGSTTLFGATGSIIAILLWIYYSSVIIFLGAALTQSWRERSLKKFN